MNITRGDLIQWIWEVEKDGVKDYSVIQKLRKNSDFENYVVQYSGKR